MGTQQGTQQECLLGRDTSRQGEKSLGGGRRDKGGCIGGASAPYIEAVLWPLDKGGRRDRGGCIGLLLCQGAKAPLLCKGPKHRFYVFQVTTTKEEKGSVRKKREGRAPLQCA